MLANIGGKECFHCYARESCWHLSCSSLLVASQRVRDVGCRGLELGFRFDKHWSHGGQVLRLVKLPHVPYRVLSGMTPDRSRSEKKSCAIIERNAPKVYQSQVRR